MPNLSAKPALNIQHHQKLPRKAPTMRVLYACLMTGTALIAVPAALMVAAYADGGAGGSMTSPEPAGGTDSTNTAGNAGASGLLLGGGGGGGAGNIGGAGGMGNSMGGLGGASAGADGADGFSTTASGGGGGGGAHGYIGDVAPPGAMTGGNGGAGGAGMGGATHGGGGGAGGWGAVINLIAPSTESFVNNITGGDGGSGGAAGDVSGQDGSGGSGGVGLYFLDQIDSRMIIVGANISGGAGGNAPSVGSSGSKTGGYGGNAIMGSDMQMMIANGAVVQGGNSGYAMHGSMIVYATKGTGIVGGDLVLNISGTVASGQGSYNDYGTAIHLTGGTNSIFLSSTSVITGDILLEEANTSITLESGYTFSNGRVIVSGVNTASLTLGGSFDGSFDLTSLNQSDVDGAFDGISQVNVNADSDLTEWTLTGSPSYSVSQWTVSKGKAILNENSFGGDVSVENSSTLEVSSAAIMTTTLQNDLDVSSGATLNVTQRSGGTALTVYGSVNLAGTVNLALSAPVIGPVISVGYDLSANGTLNITDIRSAAIR
ncbi:hypothetical protein FPY71_12235 [Aureimonas fodinaquatilis]|uniref:Autotransporter outer membrane beta-barrel domain-containing protein n=1 Tax=Aureimonas fodinaquatilis TaxID=2565783 RepID=A0A5B0DU77_9HYPH|nr:hypothetical protein [Aureimonas fodinaquatilis]KAA0969321.1 hypothetical protein FPY71_12235 [Aureimonas fodinaquatilis]